MSDFICVYISEYIYKPGQRRVGSEMVLHDLRFNGMTVQ